MLRHVITSLFRRRTTNPCIFCYNDGQRDRSADPAVIEAVFASSLGEDWRDKVRDMERPVPAQAMGEIADKMLADKDEFRRKLLLTIQDAFGVKPYSDHGGLAQPTGLIEAQQLGLLAGYNYFCADLLELARPFGSAQQRASPSPENSPTPNGSASTSPDGKSPSGG